MQTPTSIKARRSLAATNRRLTACRFQSTRDVPSHAAWGSDIVLYRVSHCKSLYGVHRDCDLEMLTSITGFNYESVQTMHMSLCQTCVSTLHPIINSYSRQLSLLAPSRSMSCWYLKMHNACLFSLRPVPIVTGDTGMSSIHSTLQGGS